MLRPCERAPFVVISMQQLLGRLSVWSYYEGIDFCNTTCSHGNLIVCSCRNRPARDRQDGCSTCEPGCGVPRTVSPGVLGCCITVDCICHTYLTHTFRHGRFLLIPRLAWDYGIRCPVVSGAHGWLVFQEVPLHCQHFFSNIFNVRASRHRTRNDTSSEIDYYILAPRWWHCCRCDASSFRIGCSNKDMHSDVLRVYRERDLATSALNIQRNN